MTGLKASTLFRDYTNKYHRLLVIVVKATKILGTGQTDKLKELLSEALQIELDMAVMGKKLTAKLEANEKELEELRSKKTMI